MFVYIAVILAGVVRALGGETISAFSMPVSKKIILIDAGHGGFDPGKIGDKDTLEKDINLQIAAKLQAYLEQGGSFVLMTRVDDDALAGTKSGDMEIRRQTANNSKADVYISIHQNSYPDSSVKGAQAFYFDDSENSKRLAECIQAEISSFADPANKREAKANSDYYVLKRTKMPAVIVECGFLTNYSDMKRLENDEYQEKIAWAIYKGIINYFEGDKRV
jgi:N-acetylmuramoyl-L-alanine amidase